MRNRSCRMSIEPFRISETAPFAPGRLAICRLPGRAGDLAGDVAIIAAWRPALVVSMTEPAEMAAKGAAGLVAALHASGIAHAHFPIRDFGAPEAADPRWPPLSARLHDALEAGERVLLHCMGGLGRSGMIAMRVMAECGHPPSDALAILRKARPGAVETPEQEAWAALGAEAPYRRR